MATDNSRKNGQTSDPRRDATGISGNSNPQGNASTKKQTPLEWNAGDIIDGIYEVRAVLGQGGMGRVYRVYQHGWNVEFAVKTPLPHIIATRGQLENFVRECNTWVGLGVHENIVTCNYVRLIGNVPRVFAEYVDGGSLELRIRDRRLYTGTPKDVLARILDIGIQFCRGLSFSHERGLIHQDVKPDNVLLSSAGVAKVADFGLANAKGVESQLAGPRPAGLSIMASFGGMTQAYCSPEQADISAMAQEKIPRDRWPQLTRRTDIYSWGVSLLEMFMGGVTWPSGNAASYTLSAYLEGDISPEYNIPLMPSELGTLLRRCMAQSPAERPGSMLEIEESLKGIYAGVTGRIYDRGAPWSLGEQVDIINNQGVSLLELRLQDEGMALLERGLHQYPDHPAVTYNLNRERWHAGRISFDELWSSLDIPENRINEAVKADWFAARASALYENRDIGGSLRVLEQASRAGLGSIAVELEEAVRARRDLASRRLASFAARGDLASRVRMARDKPWVLSTCENCVRIHDAASGSLLSEKTFQDRMVYDVMWHEMTPLVLTGNGSTLELRQADTGEIRHTATSRIGRITVARFTSSPTTVVCGSQKDMAGLCNLVRGEWNLHIENMLLSGKSPGARAVALSPDGHWLAVSFGDNVINVWRTSTGQPIHRLEGHTAPVTSLAFTLDSMRLLSGGEDTMLRLWNIESGVSESELKGHSDVINDIAVAEGGHIAVSSSGDKTVRVWSLTEKRGVFVFAEHAAAVGAVTISPGDRWAVSLGSDNKAVLLNVRAYLYECTAPRILRKPDIRKAVNAESDYHTKLADIKALIRSGKPAQAWSLLEETRRISGYARTREVRALCSEAGLYGRTIGIEDCYLLHTFDTHSTAVKTVRILPDGNHALSVDGNREFRVWNLQDGLCTRAFHSFGDMDPSEKTAVFEMGGKKDEHISVLQPETSTAIIVEGLGFSRWDLSRAAQVEQCGSGDFRISAFDLGPENSFMIAGSLNGRIRIYRGRTATPVQTLYGHKKPVSAICVSRTGSFFLSASEKGDIRLWTPGNILPLNTFKGHRDKVMHLSISRCERLALSCGKDGVICVWNLQRGRCIARLEGHGASVTCGAITPDGQYVISGAADGVIRLWDVAKKVSLHEIRDHQGAITDIDISPNGRLMASSSEDATVRVRELDYTYRFQEEGRWVAQAQAVLNTFITRHAPWKSPTQRGDIPANSVNALPGILQELQHAGLGGISPGEVRAQLTRAVKQGRTPKAELQTDSSYTIRMTLLPLIILKNFIGTVVQGFFDIVGIAGQGTQAAAGNASSFFGSIFHITRTVLHAGRIPIIIALIIGGTYFLLSGILGLGMEADPDLKEFSDALRDRQISREALKSGAINNTYRATKVYQMDNFSRVQAIYSINQVSTANQIYSASRVYPSFRQTPRSIRPTGRRY